MAVDRGTIIDVHDAGVVVSVLCTTPVVCGGVGDMTSIHKFSFREKCSKINLKLLPL
jgi:hypothetical protein